MLPALDVTYAHAIGQSQDNGLPDMARLEILRRGDLVERIGGPDQGIRNDNARAIGQAFGVPEDDSHKWFISLITMRGCGPCDRLKAAFANAPELAPFVNVRDHHKSWAHYGVYDKDDQTQMYRWKNVRFYGYPTIIIQPPLNGQYGSPKTVVWQGPFYGNNPGGYDGNAAKLAEQIREGITNYVNSLPRRQSASEGIKQSDATSQETISQTAPFDVPPAPQPYGPDNLPPNQQPFPPQNPDAVSPASPGLFSVGLFVVAFIAGMLGSGALRLLIMGLGYLRQFQVSRGQPILTPEQYAALMKTLNDAQAKNETPKPAV